MIYYRNYICQSTHPITLPIKKMLNDHKWLVYYVDPPEYVNSEEAYVEFSWDYVKPCNFSEEMKNLKSGIFVKLTDLYKYRLKIEEGVLKETSDHNSYLKLVEKGKKGKKYTLKHVESLWPILLRQSGVGYYNPTDKPIIITEDGLKLPPNGIFSYDSFKYDIYEYIEGATSSLQWKKESEISVADTPAYRFTIATEIEGTHDIIVKIKYTNIELKYSVIGNLSDAMKKAEEILQSLHIAKTYD